MNGSSLVSAPLTALTVIGILLVVLGLFVGAEIRLVALGLVSLATAALVGALAGRRG